MHPVASPCTYYTHPTSVSYWSLYFFKPEVYFSDILKKKVLLNEDTLRRSQKVEPVDAV